MKVEKYKRNVTHVKKFIEREASDNNNTNMSNESVVQFEKENSDQKVSNENHESHESENIRINQENNASVNSKENEILKEPLQTKSAITQSPMKLRPTRERKVLGKFKDYVMN